MILIYLRTFKNKKSDSAAAYKNAVYAEVIETFSHCNYEYCKLYSEKNQIRCELLMLIEILRKISMDSNRIPANLQTIIVYTTKHQLVWDWNSVRVNDKPEFLAKKYWDAYTTVLQELQVDFSNFKIKEGGIMLQAETARAQEYLKERAKTDGRYSDFI